MKLLARPNGPSLTVERAIAASPEQVFALVSDLPGMGRWSTENTGGRWLGNARASGPHVGARFVGTNRNGLRRWATLCRVTSLLPGQRFGFEVAFGPFAVADWSYDITPTEGGCVVAESWTDRRVRFFSFLASPVTGSKPDRVELTRQAIEHTLDSLASAAPGLSTP